MQQFVTSHAIAWEMNGGATFDPTGFLLFFFSTFFSYFRPAAAEYGIFVNYEQYQKFIDV